MCFCGKHTVITGGIVGATVLAWSGDVLCRHGKEPGQLEFGTNLQAPTSQSSGPPCDSQERVSLLELRAPQL